MTKKTEPSIPGGYILLSRKILENDIMSKPPLYLKLWIWLLLQAKFTTKNRGSIKTSIPEIQEAMSYYVGFRKITPSKRQISSALSFLRKPYEGFMNGTTQVPMIVTTKVTHGILVNICNYSKYQDPKNYECNDGWADEGADDKPVNGQVGAQYNNKNDKNDKKKKKNNYSECVSMTEDEYQKLIDKYGESATQEMIEILNNYKASTGRRYKSDYHAILNWVVQRYKQDRRDKPAKKMEVIR